MPLFAGTSGFAYKEWKGTFYPADLSDDAMLAHYAGRLPAAECPRTERPSMERVVLLRGTAAPGSRSGPTGVSITSRGSSVPRHTRCSRRLGCVCLQVV